MSFTPRRNYWSLFRATLAGLLIFGVAVHFASAETPGAPPTGNVAIPVEQTAAAPPSATSDANPFANKSLMGIVRDGGWMMYPLFVCSFILMVFAFERAISLRTGRVIPSPFVKRFLHQLQEGQLDRDEARLVCEENGSPTAKIFAAAVRKWGRPAVEVEQAVIDAGERATSNLRRYLRVFNGVATISPLLGLLGTVFGIIRAFGDIASSETTGRMEMLSKGISEALFCTALGLSVAIPAMVMHLYFVSRVDRLAIQIDTVSQDVVNTISAEAQQEAGQPRRSKKPAAA
jgi:biopolymer transport protein ExbB